MNEQMGWRALVKNLQVEAPKWAALLPQLPRLAHRALDENRLAQLESGLALMLRQQQTRNYWLGLMTALMAVATTGILILIFR
jgi:ubiquinone biosynthesis protein